MGSHSVTCHPAEVTFQPLPQPKLILDLATPEGCKAELTWLTGYIPWWYTRPKTVTHPSTNRARRRVTSFMRRTTVATTPRRQPHCVRWGPSTPSPKGHSPQFSAHVCCGQTAGWMKTPLGTKELMLDLATPLSFICLYCHAHVHPQVAEWTITAFCIVLSSLVSEVGLHGVIVAWCRMMWNVQWAAGRRRRQAGRRIDVDDRRTGEVRNLPDVVAIVNE